MALRFVRASVEKTMNAMLEAEGPGNCAMPCAYERTQFTAIHER